ncbi:hypothetical protein CJ419_05860 [Vibrio navarrensis]|nr:hypothetical protein [Vibrio navarrensis]
MAFLHSIFKRKKKVRKNKALLFCHLFFNHYSGCNDKSNDKRKFHEILRVEIVEQKTIRLSLSLTTQ